MKELELEKAPDLTISIASYNTKDILSECIKSIYENTEGIRFEVIVVDNASVDGSAEMIRINFTSVILIESKENVGFGRAHNRAFRESGGRYFLALNSDTYVYPGTLKQMIEFMDSHPNVGITGCKTYLDEDNTFVFPDHYIPSILNSIILYTDFCKFFPESFICKNFWNRAYTLWEAKEPIEVNGVSGGLILARKEAFQEVGGFDENYFLFFEEHDLYRETKKKRWKIFYLPNVKFLHHFNESYRNKDLSIVGMKSYRYYFKKHYGIVGLILVNTIVSTVNFIIRIYKRTKGIGQKACHGDMKFHQNSNTITIEWNKLDSSEKYCLEIAFDETFSARAGVYVRGNSFLFPCNLLEKLLEKRSNNALFWRVVSVSEKSTIRKIVTVGKLKSVMSKVS